MRRLALAAIALLALGGCTEKPKGEDYDLRVAVSTDAPVPTAIDGLLITASRKGVEKFTGSYGYAELANLPDSLLLGDGGEDYSSSDDKYTYEPIVVRVVGLLEGKEVVRRVAELEMASSGAELLRMPLCLSCFGKTCEDGLTCKRGVCEDQQIGSLGGSGLPADDAGAALTDPECPTPAAECAGRCGDPDCGACPAADTVAVEGFAVGATEVTRGEYEKFLAQNPQPKGDALGPGCDGEQTFAADPTCMADANVCSSTCTGHPQVCVDWCDAYAYCAWAGMRLCTADEWHGGCGGAGGSTFPYGGTYDQTACNANSGTTATSSSTCGPAGAEGPFDMTGNVWEWVDGCEGANCDALGGDFDSAESATCTSLFVFQRRDRSPNLGFRCCAP